MDEVPAGVVAACDHGKQNAGDMERLRGGCAITELTERDKWHMRRAKDLADEVERLRDNLREAELQTISSPNMDGMPHGSSDGDAIARQIAHRDKLEAKLHTAERELKRSRTAAGKALQHVKAPLRMFCGSYFLENATLEAAIQYARICKRTGEEYRATINS